MNSKSLKSLRKRFEALVGSYGVVGDDAEELVNNLMVDVIVEVVLVEGEFLVRHEGRPAADVQFEACQVAAVIENEGIDTDVILAPGKNYRVVLK